MRRHRKHIAATVAKAHEAHEIAHGADLLGEIRSLHGKAVGILEEAEAAGRPQTALSAIRECRATLELLGKVTGQLFERHAHLHADVGPLMPADEWRRFVDFLERTQTFKEEEYLRLKFEDMKRKGHLLEGGAGADGTQLPEWVVKSRTEGD